MIEWKRIFDMHNGTIKPNQTIEVQKITQLIKKMGNGMITKVLVS